MKDEAFERILPQASTEGRHLDEEFVGIQGEETSNERFSLEIDEPSEDEEDSVSIELDPYFTPDLSGESSSECESSLEPASSSHEVGLKRPVFVWKILFVWLVAFLVIGLAIACVVFLRSKGLAKSKRVASDGANIIRYPIPVPLYVENLEFFFLAQSKEERDLVSIELELTLEGRESYIFFSHGNVLLRDVIYKFLLAQAPVRNTYKYWENILQNALADHLKNTLPQCRIRLIKIIKLDRL
ncbi:hypothetical protein [Desulforhabdus amnigena]|uniref:Uncharacterized protein n=1 Tax=Desulforhabdus amnigena TaxID=40218 RepID=A0A9W6D3L1_9BACT|nr:hypothetical protein [Desulforhabdus amnigena]NLJ26588.1 hypothetical protein [Deltaproteobacteria bacterium]GLI33567.1 hypothetical protein DAMNIGENAA_10000 [Desulforhabdus amnigena]